MWWCKSVVPALERQRWQIALSLRPAWSTQSPGQPGLQKETLSQDKQNPKQGRGFVCGQYSGQNTVVYRPLVSECVNIRQRDQNSWIKGSCFPRHRKGRTTNEVKHCPLRPLCNTNSPKCHLSGLLWHSQPRNHCNFSVL